MKCPNCDREADFTVKEDRPGKTVKIIAKHKKGNPGPWLRDALLSHQYRRHLLGALGEECKAAT